MQALFPPWPPPGHPPRPAGVQNPLRALRARSTFFNLPHSQTLQKDLNLVNAPPWGFLGIFLEFWISPFVRCQKDLTGVRGELEPANRGRKLE